jgi:hypothetical protein
VEYFRRPSLFLKPLWIDTNPETAYLLRSASAFRVGVLLNDPWIRNPRVDGSIPSLATISNSMIRNGFRVSPADYRGRFWPEIG